MDMAKAMTIVLEPVPRRTFEGDAFQLAVEAVVELAYSDTLHAAMRLHPQRLHGNRGSADVCSVTLHRRRALTQSTATEHATDHYYRAIIRRSIEHCYRACYDATSVTCPESALLQSMLHSFTQIRFSLSEGIATERAT